MLTRRERLLQLPRNVAAYRALEDRGPHPAFDALCARLSQPAPGSGGGACGPALAQRLRRTLSQLAHWCPLFGEGCAVHETTHACSPARRHVMLGCVPPRTLRTASHCAPPPPRAAAESEAAPRLAFPLVRLFAANSHGALEAVVSLLLGGWCAAAAVAACCLRFLF